MKTKESLQEIVKEYYGLSDISSFDYFKKQYWWEEERFKFFGTDSLTGEIVHFETSIKELRNTCFLEGDENKSTKGLIHIEELIDPTFS